jgi:hypothetical protein
MRRRWGPVRLARGSQPPQTGREWLLGAVRARFPKLATALGDRAFDAMLGEYLLQEPPARRSVRESGARLAEYLARSPRYPLYFAELARLDRAYGDVLHAPAAATLTRLELALDRELRLVPAHALLELTHATDELWRALDRGERAVRPRELDWPRTLLVWRAGTRVCERVLDGDETAAMRAAVRGTSVVELAAGFDCENPQARVIDLALRWIEAGLIVR